MTNFDYNVSQGAMLRQVDEAGFAVVDANLYLDTHPCDAAAIDTIIRCWRRTRVRQRLMRHSSAP